MKEFLFEIISEEEKKALPSLERVSEGERKKLFEQVKEDERKQLFEVVVAEDKPQLFEVVAEDKPQLFEVVRENEGSQLFESVEAEMREAQLLPIMSEKKENILTYITTTTEKDIARNVEVMEPEDGRNFRLQLIDKIRNIFETSDGEKVITKYRFRVYVGWEMYETIVNASEVGNVKWVKEATEGKAIVKKGRNGSDFEEYVSKILMSSVVPEQTVYALNGWKTIGDKHIYVYANGAIGKNVSNVFGNRKYCFEFEPEKVGTKETFEQAVKMLEICKDKNISLPLFLATHIGSVTSLFEEAGHPVKFTTAVIGETNSRKTSLSLCLTKTINRKEIQIPEVTFSSTEGGIEKAIALHSDSVLVIDDYMPASTVSKQRVLDAKLEKVQRLYGDRKGIERMTDFAKNPNAGYYPVRGIGVITGEHIKGVQSSLTRSLILKIKRDSVNNDKLTYYQNNYQILNNHICGFLVYVSESYRGIIGLISERVHKYRAQNLFEIPRFNEMYAIFMTTIDMICGYAVANRFWDQGECEAIYMKWRENIIREIEENELEIKRRDWSAVLCQVCAAIIEEGTLQLPIEEEKNYGEKVFADDEIIYIRLDTFIRKVKSSFTLWGVECPNFSKQFILTELEKAGIIETRRKCEERRTLKLPGSKKNQQRFLYIKKAVVFLHE